MVSPSQPLASPATTRTQTTLMKFKKPDAKQVDKYDMMVAYYVVSCKRPLNTVEKNGFIKLLQFLKPGYNPPSRKKLTYSLIPHLYDSTKSQLLPLINEANSVAFTSDLWTSGAGESYISLSAHFIFKFKMFSITLCCRSFPGEHTGVTIKDWVLEAMLEWKIPKEKVVAMTTDNGDNIRLAVQMLSIPHVRCLGHVIQNGCDGVNKIQKVADMKKKTHALYMFFTEKIYRLYKCFISRRHDGVQPLKLPGLSPTRWWSELPLNNAIIREHNFIREFSAYYDGGSKLHLVISSEEMCFLKTYTNTLRSLEDITIAMSGEKYVTSSAILPVVYLVQSMYEDACNLQTDESTMNEDPAQATGQCEMEDFAVAAANHEEMNPPGVEATNHPDTDDNPEILECIVKKLRKRYHDDPDVVPRRQNDRTAAVASHKFLEKCSLLDPRFKDDITPEDVTSAKRQLIEEFKNSQENSDQPDSSREASDAQKVTKKATGLASIFARRHQARTAEKLSLGVPLQTPLQKFEAEITRYVAQPALDKDADPLLWWRDHEENLPALSKMAVKYLCVPATSTPSERIFSTGGNVITDERVCLTGEHAEQCIFLSMNESFIPLPK